jgi:hypothetical protein
MKFKRYYIKNKNGAGLHYIQGSLFWNYPKNISEVLEYTSFSTPRSTMKFILERGIKTNTGEFPDIGSYTVKVD